MRAFISEYKVTFRLDKTEKRWYNVCVNHKITWKRSDLCSGKWQMYSLKKDSFFPFTGIVYPFVSWMVIIRLKSACFNRRTYNIRILSPWLLKKGFSKNRNTSEISYMTNISYKATNRSNTLCIARFVNGVNDVCHRKFTVREVFRGSQMLRRFLYV